MYCSNCGNKAEEGGRFCRNCGAPLAAQPPAMQPSPAQPEQAAPVTPPFQEQTAQTPPVQTPSAQLPPNQPPPIQTQPPDYYAPAPGGYTLQPAPITENPPKRKKKTAAIIAAAVVVLLAAGAAVWFLTRNAGGKEIDYWLGGEESADIDDDSDIWTFDMGDIGESESILSVSPSGRHILTVNRLDMNFERKSTEGIPNPMGRQAKYICLYEDEGNDGSFERRLRMDIDYDENVEFNNILTICGDSGVAWNGDETRVLVTADVDQMRAYLMQSRLSIFLVNFTDETFEKVAEDEGESTGLSNGGLRYLLPKWIDGETISFTSYETVDRNGVNFWEVSLMSRNITTGEEELLADLSGEGQVRMITAYEIYGETVFFSTDLGGGLLENTGFYAVQLDGGEDSPDCLISGLELKEDIHPYANWFSSVEISSDGRWALLTAYDQRVMARDIPLADYGPQPQPDPGNAVSIMTGREWIPCHNVILYDLENNEVVDPFTARGLGSDEVLVTGAAFAPDSKSLLCAVFGGDGEWDIGDFNKTALYQVRIDDGSFDAVRVFETDVENEMPDTVRWLGNNAIFICRSEGGLPPLNPVDIVLPSAFERFIEE